MLDLLENGVSLWPKYDGRFPLVSGMKFKFDPAREPGKRILTESFVKTDGTPIEMDQKYTLGCKYFLQTGKDGYDTFLDPTIEKLFDDYKECPTIQETYIKFFKNSCKSNEEIEQMSGKAKQTFFKRLEMFNASVDKRDEKTGYIIVNPKVEDRIINVGEPI